MERVALLDPQEALSLSSRNRQKVQMLNENEAVSFFILMNYVIFFIATCSDE